MDFVSDALFDGRRIRALTVVDDCSRESLAIEVGQSITAEQVVTVMNRLSAVRGAPRRIRVDNGPEFVSRALDQWAYLHAVTLDFSRQGNRPTMRWSNLSTDGCGTNVSASTGFFHLTTPGVRSKLGVSTTIVLHATHLAMSLKN